MTSTPHEHPPRRGRVRVLLTTEGTYPHYRGGVSTWCDSLIRNVQEVDFTVWSLMMNPFIKAEYAPFPDNVSQFVGVPLWGIEQPSEYTREIPSGKVFQAARRTRESDVEAHFVPVFERFYASVTSALFEPDDFAAALGDMHDYFRTWDYRETWRSRAVWESFKRMLLRPAGFDLPVPEPEPDHEPPIPRWGQVKDNLRHLRGGRRDPIRIEDVDPDDPRFADVPTVGEAIEGLRWLYRLLQTLNVEVPETDVTHSAAAAFCAIPCILAKIQRGTPFLLTEHGVYLREQYLNIERQGFAYNLKRFLIDLVSAVAQTSYRMADQISPVCAFNSRWEIAYGATSEQIDVIYNGIDEKAFRPMSVDRPSAPTVVQTGRIDPLKDMLAFLRVADRVRRDIPDVQFLHFGNITNDEYWVQVQDLWRELGLERTVRWQGYTNDVPAAINQGDVVLLTSISEAFPYAVVEALACGKPVVSTAVGGVKEALNGTGSTASPGDIDGLADATVAYLRMAEAERNRLSRLARERAVENFTLDTFSGRYRDSYFRLAEIGRTAVPVRPPVTADETAELPALPPAQHAEPDIAPAAEAPRAHVSEPAPAPRADDEHEITLLELREALASDDPFVRASAIRRVRAELGVTEAVGEALGDPSPAVRREAVRSLARVSQGRAAQALTDVAVHDPVREVREEAVSVLAQLLTDSDREYGAGA